MFVYVELHAHSAFSFLDGASLPDELAAAAVELGYDAFALTDHDGLCGSMEFAQAAAGLGLRAIHGAETALEDGRHVTLLVEDAAGWRNLCRIVTAAHVHDRDPHDPPPRVPFATLEEHARGLVCLSGCARQGVHDEAGLQRLKRIFGPDRLRVELQRPFQRDDRARNNALARLAQRVEVPTVATGNVHAHTRSRGAAAGRVRRAAQPHDARRLRAHPARQLLPRARFAHGDGGPLRRRPPRRPPPRPAPSPTA